MKQCPICKTTYSDDSLAFCLSDGTNLISVSEPPATQLLPFEKMRVEIPSVSPYQSNPTIISAPNSAPKKNGRGLTYALVIIGLLVLIGAVGTIIFLIYNSGGFGKKEVALNNSATPSPVKSADNTQELKDRLANLEKQLNDQKNAKSNSVTSPLSTPTSPSSNSSSGAVIAKVSSTSDGFLALRSAPRVDGGEQILKITTGATVKIEDCQRNYTTISGRRGRWCMVTYNGETGWAFDAWLIY